MPSRQPTTTHSAEYTNLHRLLALRNIAIVGQILAVYIAAGHMGMRLPVISIGMVIAILAAFNLFSRMRLKWGGSVSPFEFLFQLIVDVLVLSALLYQTGGASNPFVLLFLMPIIIATVVLPARHIWVLTFVTAICYSLLIWKYIPLPHAHGSESGFQQHVFGMWVSFVVSAAATAYFVVGMRRTLRDKELALASAREKQMRDESLIALGTLAASTVHEISTPLGTMALISEDLEHELGSAAPACLEQVNILKKQINRCKQALATLSASAGGVYLTGGNIIPVTDYLQAVLNEWQQYRSDVAIKVQWRQTDSAACILSDRTLTQALTNILDNAADASPNNVEWLADWNEHTLKMDINDRGEGLSHEASEKVGQQPFSEKGEGLGLGLFLSHSVISRFGGEVNLYNRKDRGVTTHISLPLANPGEATKS